MKVFLAFILDRKSDSFKNTRINNTNALTCLVMYLLYIRTSVGYCLFVFGFCQNLLSDKHTTPHFLFLYKSKTFEGVGKVIDAL